MVLFLVCSFLLSPFTETPSNTIFMTKLPLYNWYFIEKVQWHVTDLWNSFLNFLPIFLYLELNCNQFEFSFCILVYFCGGFLFVTLWQSSVPFSNYKNTNKKCVTSNAFHDNFIFLMQFQHKYIYYNWMNYFCRSSHLYFKIVLPLSE